MALETGVNFLNDLVETNPVGATDPKSELDNHLQNVKRAVKATFPGMAGQAWRMQTKTGSYALTVTDNMTQINVTAAATISGTAATLGNGFAVIIWNGHTAAITVPGPYLVQPGAAALLTCNGVSFSAFHFGVVSAANGFPVMRQSPVGNPRIDFDTLDAFGFNQSTNVFTLSIGGGSAFVLSSSVITLGPLVTSVTGNAGNVYSDGAGTLFRQVSLRQYKTEIEPLTSSAKFDMLRPVKYRSLCDTDAGQEFYGFIAEEVSELFPLAGVRDSEGNLSNYSDRAIIALLVTEVQKLRQRLESLENP